MEVGIRRVQSLNYYEMVRKGEAVWYQGRSLTPAVDARGSKYTESGGSRLTPGCILYLGGLVQLGAVFCLHRQYIALKKI